ncbi:hypothetical protein BG004_002370 [Podila humilis]|nr:hypothetical protein BG004_002370 [Podila humilis]
MEILDKRMNDKGKNWRHVFKALTVLDYLLHVGSENVVRYARDNLYIVKTLKEFQYIDEDGKDQGSNVRQKAKDITALLSDEARLKEERRSRSAMRDRMSGRAPGEGRYEGTTPVYERPGAGDEDRDLQRALEESRRMARENSGGNSDDDDLKAALALSKKDEQDRQKNVEKYNELSLTEDWDADSKPTNQNELNNDDFFGNGNNNNNSNNNNNNFDSFSAMNNFDNSFIQSQPTGFNNPYLQFQQQQLQQQQFEQQQLMQQQMMQQQMLQQQQQQMAMMNNPYQQQLMPQMTGAPPQIGSNNPFSAFAIQQANANKPFEAPYKSNLNNNTNNNNNNNNGFNFGTNGTNSNTTTNNNSNSLGELAFLQNAMSNPVASQPQPQPATTVSKAPNAHDEKYAHLAFALSNRDDGMDTFGNTGQLRMPSHHTMGGPIITSNTSAANPFQRMGGNRGNNQNVGSNSLIDISDPSAANNGGNTNNNPFQSLAAGGNGGNGFMSSQPTGFGASNGAYSSNTLF